MFKYVERENKDAKCKKQEMQTDYYDFDLEKRLHARITTHHYS